MMDAATGDAPSLTEHVARFATDIRYENIPDDVMRLGKKAILDGLGVALSGSKAQPSLVLRDYLSSLGCGAKGATLFGTSVRLPARFAALANGTAMHADDYDDTLQAETGRYQGVHPTAPVLSALFAVAETEGYSGKDLLTAYHAGVEVTCRLFDATHVNHILHGFHSTATCGMVGASAGVARLRHADLMQARHTLGIAASQSGGFQQNFGTSTKPYQAGRSAECAIVADDLARRGFTASTIILEARRGFFMAQGGGHEESRIRGKLGNPWSFVERGIWLKPFPTGSLSHPGMTRMLELVRTHDIHPDQVATVRLRTSENIHQTLMHHKPRTELEAKFSLEFCLAALLVSRACGLAQFTDEYVNRPDVQEAISKVRYTGFSESEARSNGYTIVTTFVEIDLKDGSTVGGRIDHGKGNIADPMSEAEVSEKFRECAGYAGLPPEKAERAIALTLELEKQPNLAALADSLRKD